MKTFTTFTLFITMVFAISFFTATVNCAAVKFHGDKTSKSLLPEKREGNCGHGRLCKRMNDESDLVTIIERDEKKHKPLLPERRGDKKQNKPLLPEKRGDKKQNKPLLPEKREGNCGYGRLCKRTNDETESVKVNERDDKKFKNTLPGNVKREGILVDSLNCGHGRLCKRMNDESDVIKVIERGSIIPKPDCASHLCKKRSLNEDVEETDLSKEIKRASIIPKPDCASHLCKKRSLNEGGEETLVEEKKRDKIIPKPDCASHLCKKRSLNENEGVEETKQRHVILHGDGDGQSQ